MNKKTTIQVLQKKELAFVVGGKKKKKKCSFKGANKVMVGSAIIGAAGGPGMAGASGLLSGIAYGVTQCLM